MLYRGEKKIRKSTGGTIQFTWNSRKSKTNLKWQRTEQWLPGAEVGNRQQRRTEEVSGWWKCSVSWPWWRLWGVYIFIKTHGNVHSKWEHFIVHKFISIKLFSKQELKTASTTDTWPWSISFGSRKVPVISEETLQTVSFVYSQEVRIRKRDERNVFCFVLFTLCPSHK